MTIIKRVSVLLLLLLIVLLLVCCDSKKEGESETKEYSSNFYTLKYPSEWAEPELVEGIHWSQTLWKMDSQFSFKISTRRVFSDTYINKDDILKALENVEFDIEECSVDGNEAYKIKMEDNGQSLTLYITQIKDIVFELHFACEANEYNKNQTIMDQIIKESFKINDFVSFSEIKEDWNKYSIDNLEVYYPDSSKIYDSVEKWSEKRVEAFNYIAKYLDVYWDHEPIELFVFNSKEHGKQYDLTLGFAIPEYKKIFTEHSQTPGHELAHVISYYINSGERIDSALINEGLATHLNMTNNDYHRLAADILQDKNYSIKLLGDDFRENKGAYTLGASFVKYLIDEYGIELFKEFFAQSQYSEEESFIKFYDKNGDILINEWMEFLKTY